MKYVVILERAQNNWAAYVPDLPACFRTARSLEKAKINIREAIEGLFEDAARFWGTTAGACDCG
ncbi:MAG: type II toxin-antitoxin system HicB family antitoxin [Bryobacterales bacterium]|nr:type II toxin-antitoxin system HicB family antitoxin [Bryobacterales bacterium]